MLRPAIELMGIMTASFIAMPSAIAGERTTSPPPAAQMRPVETNYFGTLVRDAYRWMEDPHSAELDAWVKAQGEYTRAVLDGLPWHDDFVRRVNELVSARTEVSAVRALAGRIYYLKRAPGEAYAKLYVREALGAAERLLLDPAALGGTTLDYYAPSPDGSHIAFGLSSHGSEASVLGVLDVATKKVLPDRIDRARGADPFWLPDGRSFFYMRQRAGAAGAEALLKMRTYLHVLGRHPDEDPAVFGFEVSERVPFGASDMPLVMVISGSPNAIGVIRHGAQKGYTIYYAPLDRVGSRMPWKKLVDVADEVTDLTVHGRDVYVLTNKGAGRSKVVRTRLDASDLRRAETVIAPSQAVVRELNAAADAIYVGVLDGGIGRILRISYDGGAVERVPLPYDGSVSDLTTSPTMPGVLFQAQTWVRAPSFYRYDPTAQKVVDTGLIPPVPVDTSAYESIEVQAKSADGTAIPLSIVYRKGLALDGARPTWLSGYGSYGDSLDPTFTPRRLAWFDRGGIYAVAHVRGGGEFGREWHLAGIKKNKQNSVDDFVACARYLIDHKYTSPAHLGAEGSSAGGITVGGAVTQHPELFGAALIRVGISDVVRFEETPGGPANALEFGSAKVADEFKDLYAMSPYHQVKDGAPYPAVMLTGAVHDARVPLWEPAKMTARLQAASGGKKPVLLRVAYDAGHGAASGTPSAQVSAEVADCYTFFYWQLSRSAAQR
jgi:prolyl oligopeptidase